MRIYEIINEAEASDADLKGRYGEFSPEDIPMMPNTKLGREPGPTLWSAYSVVQDILGSNNVTDDEDYLEPNMYLVYQSNAPMFRGMTDTEGTIELPNLYSNAAADVAIAAHEAYHAYVHRKAGGGAVHANEKIVNNLAEKWLRKHLSGTQLYIALEKITGSRVHYGHNYLPKGPKR